MIQSGDQIRFTAAEIEEGISFGLDLSGVHTSTELSVQLVDWIEAVSVLRFEVVEAMARELARQKGVSLPPLLVSVPADVVPSGDPKSRIGPTDCAPASCPFSREDSGVNLLSLRDIVLKNALI
ncbi:MAG: hypothetical protein H6R17_1797 [Proteobacteria bacterium]|nr:hypothetical protein [Pseudomonadota bacterium]